VLRYKQFEQEVIELEGEPNESGDFRYPSIKA